jgi:hypothetical protein
MRTFMIFGAVLLGLTASGLRAGENAPPAVASGAAGTIDLLSLKERFARLVQTEDPKLNALVESL